MAGRWTILLALASVVGPIGQSSARADSIDLVQQYLDDIGARQGTYTIRAVTEDFVGNAFPDIDFFEVFFRQYPVAVLVPEGLAASNVFFVEDGEVFPLTSPADLEDFFFDELAPVADNEEAADAGLAWLRLSEGFSQDGFFTFGIQPSALEPKCRPVICMSAAEST
jgi:hypothetical protein